MLSDSEDHVTELALSRNSSLRRDLPPAVLVVVRGMIASAFVIQ